MTKMTKTLTDKDKFSIIEHMRNQPMFFDSSNTNYKLSKKVKERKLETFAKSLSGELSGEDVLKMFNQLKGQYRTYRKTYMNSASGIDGQTRYWKFFEAMKFLNDYIDAVEVPKSVDQSHFKAKSPPNWEHQFEQCSKSSVFVCGNCKVFKSTENDAGGRLHLHTHECFSGAKPVLDLQDDTNSISTEVYGLDDDDSDDTLKAKKLPTPHAKRPESSKKSEQNKKMKLNSKDERTLNASLIGALDRVGSRHINQQNRSSNELYCDGLLIKLNRIYDPNKHGEDSERYFELEDIKSTIDKTINDWLRTHHNSS